MFLHTLRTQIDEWSVRTQLKARRNAMLGATALAQRIAEAREVDEFLAHHYAVHVEADEFTIEQPAVRHA